VTVLRKILVFIIIVILIIISPFIITRQLNNISSSNYAKQLYNCPLPSKTSLIAKESDCGNLGSAGNHMDFIAALLIQSNLSLDELESYYNNYAFKPAKTSSSKDHITKNGAGVWHAKEFLSSQEIRKKYFTNIQIKPNYYIVIIADYNYPTSIFELRGH
jgi:hypothetical protein